MTKLTREEWDDRYTTTELIWGAAPNQFLVREAADLPAGRALDLATGEGRNAIWLARRGWDVTGVDFSAVALGKAREIAADTGVGIEWVEADVIGYAPEPAAFDLVTILYLHLERPARRQVLAAASRAVAPGGTLLIVGHDLDNLTRGYGGPQDPARLWVAEDAVEELVGLEIEHAGQVLRVVETDAGSAEAIDTLIRAGARTDATEATGPGMVPQLRRRTPSREHPSDLPVAEMVVVGVAVFTITALAFFRVAILPSIGDDLAMSTAQLGFFSASYAVGRVLTDLPAGHLADRLPVVVVMRRAAWVVALGSGLLAIAPVSAVAFAGMFVLGIGTALANTSGATYFSTVAPVSRRGLAVSGFAGSQLGGQAFGPAISGALATLGTWRTSEVAAVFIAVALIVGTYWGRVTAVLAAHAHRSRKGGDRTGTWTITWPMRLVLNSIPFVMFLTIGSMIQTLAPIIGKDEFGLTAGVIGLAAGLGGLCRFAGALVGGQVADRVGRKAALVPGLVLQSIGVALLAVGHQVAIWVISIALLSLGSIGTAVAMAVLGDVAEPGTLGRLLGRFRFWGDIGLIVGPILTAWLYDAYGKAAAVLPVAGLVALCAVAAMAWIPETRWGNERRRPALA